MVLKALMSLFGRFRPAAGNGAETVGRRARRAGKKTLAGGDRPGGRHGRRRRRKKAKAEERTPLAIADPQRFLDIVRMEDAGARISALGWFDDIASCEFVRHGVFSTETTAADADAYYRKYLLQAPEEMRLRIEDLVAGVIERNAGIVAAGALMPFVQIETMRNVVAAAVRHFVDLAPAGDDPLAGPRAMAELVESHAAANPGAVFGALLHLGDPRVTALIRPLRDGLDDDAVNEAVLCPSGVIHAATVAFYLDWLEATENKRDGVRFASLTSGLQLLKRRSPAETVFTGLRPFPANSADDAEYLAMAKPVPLADYLPTVASRMLALEAAEPPPRVMPHVLREWGLTPASAPGDIASLTAEGASEADTDLDELPAGQFVEVGHEWSDGEGLIHFLWGILDPNGPTLLAVGDRAVIGGRRLFFRILSPAGGVTTFDTEVKETLGPDDIRAGCRRITAHHLAEDTESIGVLTEIPHFLVTFPGDTAMFDLAAGLLREGNAASGDWGEELAYLRLFGTDFFGNYGARLKAYAETEKAKAAAEGRPLPPGVDEAAERWRDVPVPEVVHSELSPALFAEWRAIVGDPDFQTAAVTTLRDMWYGAVAAYPEQQRAASITYDDVHPFIARYLFSPEAAMRWLARRSEAAPQAEGADGR